jgi:DNA-binding transcriptional MerR regulator
MPQDGHGGAGDRRMFTFTVKDIKETFGISRSTLIYYEKIGVVRPRRSEKSQYRLYSEQDVFRLMNASFLKGLGVAPRNISSYLDADAYDEENFRKYFEMIDRRLAYAVASRECMNALNAIPRKLGTIELGYVEPYYICWDHAEGGYHDFPVSENLNLLIAHMPLGSLGSYGDDSYIGTKVSIRWGRTVAVKYAHLIDGLRTDIGMDIIGGCRCVIFYHFESNLYAMTQSQTFAKKDGDRIMDFMHENHVHRSDKAFWPYTLPGENGFYVMTCIPVADDEEESEAGIA